MPGCDRVLRFHVAFFQCSNRGVVILCIGETAVNLRRHQDRQDLYLFGSNPAADKVSTSDPRRFLANA